MKSKAIRYRDQGSEMKVKLLQVTSDKGAGTGYRFPVTDNQLPVTGFQLPGNTGPGFARKKYS
jgi:hypothetical protein